MSWLRSAINKAAEVGGKNIAPNLSRTVKTVAQQASHAVAGGAKLVQDRLVGRNLNNLKNAIKRLDEVSLNSRGVERVQAVTRWLGALKEIGKECKPLSMMDESRNGAVEEISGASSDELPSPRRASMVLFYDFDSDGEPMNFREIFLRSHAIENIVSSMILEAPADEEVHLLLEMFGLCLVGGKELHIALISSIQDLAKAFALYPEESMIKREDLLEYARNAVDGLKLNADLERLESEIAPLMQLISEKHELEAVKEDGSNRTKELIQLDIQLRDLLQRKKALISATDSQETRTLKVKQLRDILKSLELAAAEAEKQIGENRNQKEEALKYRVTKAEEVSEMEKAVAAEVKLLEQKREELEARLKEVKSSLALATNRHINIQEEKEQFDEASTKLVAHLALQEEDLTRSISSRNAAGSVVGTWVGFLEDTWKLQASCVEEQGKHIGDALNGLKDQFTHAVISTLSYHQEELSVLIKQLESCWKEIQDIEIKSVQTVETREKTVDKKLVRQRLHERFLEIEGQVITVLRTVEVLREEVRSFCFAAPSGHERDVEKRMMDAFEIIGQERERFESLQRPELKVMEDSSHTTTKPSLRWADPIEEQSEHEAFFDEENFSPGKVAPDFHSSNSTRNIDAQEETEGWEFDELEDELKRETMS